MENFLVFRCDGKDLWKLEYFSIGLRCDVPIIEALFYTTMAWAAWSYEHGEETKACLLQLCKKKIETFHQIQLQWNKQEMCFEGADDEGKTIKLSVGEETYYEIYACFVAYGRHRRLSITINENEEEQLNVNVYPYGTTGSLIRPGNFESTLDTHLKLLFNK